MADYQLLGDGFGYHPSYGSTGNAANNNPGGPNLGPGMGPGGPQSVAANSALMAQMMSSGAVSGGPGYPGMMPPHGSRTHGIPQRSLGFGPPLPMPPGSSGPSPGSLSGPSSLGDAAKMHDQYASSGYGGVQSSIRGGNYPTHDSRYGHSISGYPMSMGGGPVGPSSLGPMSQHNGGIPPQASMASLQGPNSYQTRGLMSGYSDQRMLTPSPYSSPYGPTGPGGSSDLWHNQGISHVQQRAPYGYGGGSAGIPPQPSSSVHGSRGGPAPSSFGPPSSDYGSLHSQQSKSSQGQPPHSQTQSSSRSYSSTGGGVATSSSLTSHIPSDVPPLSSYSSSQAPYSSHNISGSQGSLASSRGSVAPTNVSVSNAGVRQSHYSSMGYPSSGSSSIHPSLGMSGSSMISSPLTSSGPTTGIRYPGQHQQYPGYSYGDNSFQSRLSPYSMGATSGPGPTTGPNSPSYRPSFAASSLSGMSPRRPTPTPPAGSPMPPTSRTPDRGPGSTSISSAPQNSYPSAGQLTSPNNSGLSPGNSGKSSGPPPPPSGSSSTHGSSHSSSTSSSLSSQQGSHGSLSSHQPPPTNSLQQLEQMVMPHLSSSSGAPQHQQQQQSSNKINSISSIIASSSSSSSSTSYYTSMSGANSAPSQQVTQKQQQSQQQQSNMYPRFPSPSSVSPGPGSYYGNSGYHQNSPSSWRAPGTSQSSSGSGSNPMSNTQSPMTAVTPTAYSPASQIDQQSGQSKDIASSRAITSTVSTSSINTMNSTTTALSNTNNNASTVPGQQYPSMYDNQSYSSGSSSLDNSNYTNQPSTKQDLANKNVMSPRSSSSNQQSHQQQKQQQQSQPMSPFNFRNIDSNKPSSYGSPQINQEDSGSQNDNKSDSSKLKESQSSDPQNSSIYNVLSSPASVSGDARVDRSGTPSTEMSSSRGPQENISNTNISSSDQPQQQMDSNYQQSYMQGNSSDTSYMGQPPSDSSMYPGQHQSNQSQPGWDYGSSYNQNYDMSMTGEGGMSSSYNMGPDSMMYNQNYNQSSSMTPMMSNQMNQGEYGSSSMGDMNQSQPFDPYGDTFDQEPPMTKKKGKGRPRKDPAEPKKEKKPRAPRQPKGAGRGRGRGARNSPEARMGPPTSPYPTQPHPMGIPGQIPQVYDNSYPMRGPPNEIDPSMMSGPPYPPPPIDPTMGNVMPYPPPPPPPSSIGPQNQDIYSSDPAANSMPPLGPPPSHEMERMSNEMMYPQHEPNSMGSESSEYKPITGDSTISYDSQPLPPSIPQTQIQQSSEEQPAQHQSDLTYNQNADDPVSDQLPTEQPSEDNSKIAQNDLINQPYSLASETGNVNNNEITRVVDSNIDSNTCSNNFDDPSLKSISNDESLLGITGNENLKQVASPSSIDQRQEQQQQELTKQDSTTLLDQSFPSQTSAPPPPIEVPQLLPPPPELPPTISESACEEGIVISKLEFNEEQTSSSTPVKRKGKKRKPKDDIVPFEGDPFMSTEGHQTFFSEDGQEAKKKKRKKKKKPEGETINEVIEGVEASGVGEDGQEKPKKKRKKKPKKKPEEEENITKPVGEDNDPIEKAENIENVSTTNYQEDTTIDDTQNIEENIFSESKPAPKKKSKKSKPKLKDASSKNKKKLPKLALKFGKAKKRKRLGSSDASDIEKTPPPSPEDPESASLKRRSARNTKRQKYTDDIDLDLSEEDSDLINKLAEAGSIDSQKKLGDNNVQVTAITEDTMVVDKIMASRMAERELEIEEGEENNGGPHKIQVEEYYVKYKNLSYLHCEWKTEDELESGDKRVGQKIKRWKQKKESEIDINFLEDEPFNPDYTEVDRILDVTEIEDVYEEEVDVDDDEDDARSDTKVEIFPVILGENGAPESKKEIDSDQDKHKAASIDTEVTIAPVAMPEITEPKVELESSSELNTGSVNELGPKSENECKPEAEDPTLKTDNIKEENQHKSANDVIADPTSLNHSKKLADSEISSSQDIEMKDSDLQSTKESNELEGVTSVEVKVHTVLPIDDVDSIKEESKNESSDLSEIEKPQSPKSSKEDTMEIEHKVDEIKSDANLDEKDKIEKFDNSNEEKKETNIEQDETKTETRKKKKITKKRIVRHYLVKWRALPYEESTWELEDDLDPLKIAHFWKFKSPPPKDKWKPKKRPKASEWKKLNASPDYKSDNTLREYQLEGVNWLMFCWHNGRNCILADEMGLGKTIQSIAFVQEMFKQGITGPFLIIVPLSTIGNWQREFETWTDLNVITYHGSSASRNMLQEYEMYYKKESGERIEGIYKFQVMITTFEIVLTDCLELREISWRTCIIDEAHRLKNRNCKLLEGLRLLNMEHRVLLTGTPLQNNVEELFSLLNFLEPAQFASSELFLSEFGDLKTEDQVDKLKALLKPMMLRRLKEDVEKSLAPKEETIIEVELTNVQKKYYRAILERNFQFLTKGNTKANIPNLMNTMMELRKCCIHPYLINGAEEQILLEYRQNKPDSPTFHLDALVHASGKLVLIDKLLPRLKANGHRVLIFSQMVRCLDILEDYLCQKRYPFERIDGRVRGNMRQAAIDRFSKPDSDRFVFLLCTRAGGLGINLTAADTVIIFDSDWNPQNDLQAQARCHRIGQSKMVKVYRLICRNTYEREMFDKASLKLGLDRAVLQSMNTSGALTGDAGNGLSKKEVEDLLRKGAYGAIMDDDNAGDKFCEEDIEQILQRRTQVITLESEEKGSTFSKASFAASDNRSDIEIDDPNFWEKWAKKAQLDVDELTGKNELIVQEPRRRTQTKRFGQDDAMLEISEGDSSDEDDADVSTRTRGGKTKLKLKKGKRGREREDEFMEDFAPGNWTKAECYQVEKGLLSYGWGRWDKFLEMGIFKRHLTLKDIEHVARVIMLHCLQNFRGDEKKKETSFYWDIITPSQPKDDEQKSVKVPLDDEALSPPSTKKRGKRSKNQPPPPPSLPPPSLSQPDRPLEFYEWIKEDIYNPDLLLPEDYRNHVTKIANKILLRFKLLWYLKTEIFGNICDQIIRGISCREASFSPPCKDGYPGMPGWWDEDADKSLLMGVFKHGYDRYNLMRQDPALCFLTRCGPPDGAALMAELQSTEDPTKDEDDEIDTPLTSSSTLGDLRRDQIRETSAFGEEFMPFPSSSDLNRRFRNLISAYQRNVKKLERLEKLERFEAAVREKENKRREAAQRKWSKREEADFYRTIVSYGVEYNQISKRYDWSRFRILSKLDRKIDESLTEYYKTFHAMCKKVTGRPLTDEEENYSSIIDPISEEKASRALARIELLNKIREEILPHPELDERLSLCQNSIDLPDWWICGKHDKDLLIGTAKYGLSRLDINLRNDPDLSFSSILTNQDFLTKAKFEKQLPEEVVKENLPNVECETKLSESVPETQDGHNTQKEEKEDKKGASQEDKLVNNEKESEQENCEKLNQVDSKTIDEEPKNSEKFDDFEIKKEEEPMPLTKTEESVSEGKSGVVDNEIEKMEVDENAADFKQQLEPKTKDTDATEDEKDANISISENKSSQREDEDVKTSSQIERANESTQDEDNSDRKEIKVQSEEESEKETNKISVEEKDDPMENDANESKELKADKKKTVDNDDKQKEEESDDDTNKTKHASDQVVKKEEEISDNSKKEISDKDDKSSCEIEEKVVNEDLPTIKEENSTTSDTKSQETANNSNILTLLESDTNYLTQSNINFARRDPWPKERVLQVRLEHVCYCVEKGEWPTSKMNISSVSGTVPSTPSIATADSSPRAASPESISSMSREPTPHQTPTNTPRHESVSPPPDPFLFNPDNALGIMETLPRSTRTRGRRRRRYELESNDRARLRNLLSQPDVITTSSKKTMHTPPSTSSMMTSNASFLPPLFTLSFQNFRNELAAAAAASAEDTKGSSLLLRESGLNQARSKPVGSTSSPLLPPPASIKTPLSSITNPLGKASSKSQGAPPPAHQNSSKSKRNPNLDTMDLTFGHAPKPLPGQQPMTPANKPFSPPDKLVKESSSPSDPSSVLDLSGPPKKDSDRKGGSRSDALAGLTSSGSSALGGKSKTGKRIGRRIDDLATNLLRQKKMLVEKQDDVPVKESKLTPPPREAKPRSELDKVDTRTSTIPKDRTRTPPAAHSSSHSSTLSAALTRDLSMKAPEKSNFLPPKGLSSSSRSRDTSSTASSSTAHHSTTFDTNLKSNLPKLDLSFSEQAAALKKFLDEHPELLSNPTFATAALALSGNSSIPANTQLLELPESRKRSSRGRPKSDQHLTAPATAIGQTSSSNTIPNIQNLTGEENVPVINRISGKKLSGSKAPTLKQLPDWLKKNPMFDIDPKWAAMMREKFPMFKSPTPQPTSNSGSSSGSIRTRTSDRKSVESSNTKSSSSASGSRRATASSLLAASQANNSTTSSTSTTPSNPTSSSFGFPPSSLNPLGFNPSLLSSYPFNKMFMDPTGLISSAASSSSSTSTNSRGNASSGTSSSTTTTSTTTNPMFFPFGGLASMGLGNPLLGLPGFNFPGLGPGFNPLSIPGLGNETKKSDKGSSSSGNQDKSKNNSDKSGGKGKGGSNAKNLNDPSSIYNSLPFLYPNPNLLYNPLGLSGFSLPGSPFASLAAQSGLMNGLGGLGLGSTSSTSTTTSTSSTSHAKSSSHSKSKETKSVSRPNLISPSLPKQSTPKPSPSPASIKSPTNIPSTISQTASLSASNLPSRDLITTPIATGLSTISGMIDSDDESLKSLMGQEDDEDDLNGDLEDLNENLDTDTDVEHGGNGDAGSKKSKPKSSPRPPSSHSSIKSPPMTTETKNSARRGSTSSNATIENETTKDSAT